MGSKGNRMRNRAKCKLCEDIIESCHQSDYVSCRCDEISIAGGTVFYHCSAKDWNHFMRIDDEGNEIMIKVKEIDHKPAEIHSLRPNKKELIKMLEEMKDTIDNLPQNAMSQPITHYDHLSLIILVLSIFRADCIEDS